MKSVGHFRCESACCLWLVRTKTQQVDTTKHPDFVAKVKTYATKVGPGDLLQVPWGWAVCEAALNNEVSSGVRWVDARPTGTVGLSELIKVIAPKPDEVKPNTSVALLLKIIKAQAKNNANIAKSGAFVYRPSETGSASAGS